MSEPVAVIETLGAGGAGKPGADSARKALGKEPELLGISPLNNWTLDPVVSVPSPKVRLLPAKDRKPLLLTEKQGIDEEVEQKTSNMFPVGPLGVGFTVRIVPEPVAGGCSRI